MTCKQKQPLRKRLRCKGIYSLSNVCYQRRSKKSSRFYQSGWATHCHLQLSMSSSPPSNAVASYAPQHRPPTSNAFPSVRPPMLKVTWSGVWCLQSQKHKSPSALEEAAQVEVSPAGAKLKTRKGLKHWRGPRKSKHSWQDPNAKLKMLWARRSAGWVHKQSRHFTDYVTQLSDASLILRSHSWPKCAQL